jgi:hypothetical protein
MRSGQSALVCRRVSKQENRKYLGGLWARALLPVALIAIVLVTLGRSNRLSIYWTVMGFMFLGVFGFIAALVWWKLRATSKAMANALRLPTPEPLLELLDRSFRTATVADADAFQAQSRSTVLAMYGEGERARAVLRAIDWERRAPLVRAAGVVSESLIALVCDGDFARGLSEALRARSLAEVTRGTPGAKTSDRVYATVVALAQVLANKEEASTLPTLEDSAKAKLFPKLQAIAVAGLAAHAHRAGTAESFEARRSELVAIAPKLDEVFFGAQTAG